jgi:hypothetical protein
VAGMDIDWTHELAEQLDWHWRDLYLWKES